MNKSIISIEGKTSMPYLGAVGYEIEIKLKVNEEIYYIHATSYVGEYYTLSRKSNMDYLRGINDEQFDYLEEYDSYEDTKESKFAPFYKIAKENLYTLCKYREEYK